MKSGSSNNIKKTLGLMACVLVTSSIISCNGAGGTSGGTGGTANTNASTKTTTAATAKAVAYTAPVAATAITIDDAGVVPIVGNKATQSSIWVHNNSTSKITGITYTTIDNNSDNTRLKQAGESVFSKALHKLAGIFSTKQIASIRRQAEGSINTQAAGLCSTIGAGKSCRLDFITASPGKSVDFQGALSITAKYKLQGQEHSFAQIISYKQVFPHSPAAMITSGVHIHAQPNVPSYGTVYIYGGSAMPKVFKVKNMKLSKPGFRIVQGDMSQLNMATTAVRVVEIEAPALRANEGTIVNLSTDSSAIGTGLKSAVSHQMANILVTAEPIGGGAILNFGNVPTHDTSLGIYTGEIFVQNAGNQTATIGNIDWPAGVSTDAGTTTCVGTLAPEAGCNIGFTIAESQPAGNGTVTLHYASSSSASVATNLTWYNNGTVLLSVTTEPNVVYDANANPPTPHLETVTYTQKGTLPVSNISVVTPSIIGSGSTTPAVASSGDCTSTTVLHYNQSCTMTYSLTSTTAETGKLMTNVTYSYPNITGSGPTTRTTTRGQMVNYTALDKKPLLRITAADLTSVLLGMTIVGNDVESTTQMFYVTNMGDAPANITAESLADLSGFSGGLTKIGGTCGGILAESQTCSVVGAKFGPVLSSSTTNVQGSGIYTVTYHGGTIESTSPANTIESFMTVVTADNESISIDESVTFPGPETSPGKGPGTTPLNAYTYYGFEAIGKIVITYTNTAVIHC